MALFHLSVTQTKRSAGQSAIASAAYRAGERLYSEYYGEYSDYTRKGGVIGEIKEIIKEAILEGEIPNDYEAAYALMERLAEERGLWKKQ